MLEWKIEIAVVGGRPSGHLGWMLFLELGVALKRLRAARLARIALLKSVWPTVLED